MLFCKLCDKQIQSQCSSDSRVMQGSITDILKNVVPCSTYCILIVESNRSKYLIWMLKNRMLPCPQLEAHGLKRQAGMQSC